MLEKILKTLSVTTSIILFLYLCGSLYLISFWGIFRIDFTNLVGITDIPKNFLHPFSMSIGLMATSAFFSIFLLRILARYKSIAHTYRIIIKRYRAISLLLNSLIYICLAFVVFTGQYFRLNEDYWYIVSISFTMLLTARVLLSKKYRQTVKCYKGAKVATFFIILIPISSLSLGFEKSARIYKNQSLTFVKAITDNNNMKMSIINNNQNMKFIGFLGDKLIISSLDNEKIFVISQKSVGTIELSTSSTVINHESKTGPGTPPDTARKVVAKDTLK